MGLLGTMTVRFGADTSGLTSGISQAKSILGGFPTSPMAAVKDGFLLAGAAVVGFAASSVKTAADFQQSVLKVQAYAGLTKKQADDMSASLLNMATAVGQSPKALSDALYPIVSAGYSASESLNILKLSAMTAAASGADTAKVADGLTTALKAMGAPASSAGIYMDIINKTTAQGKMEIPGYAAIVGKLSLAASGAKVPFVDMNAALATLTTHGFPSVAQASNSLGNLFTQVGVKTDALAQHAKKLKLDFDAHAFSTMSLGDKLNYLQKITGGNQGELLKLVGGSTLALKAFNALQTGSGAYTDNLKALQNASGTTTSVFQTASGGFNASMARVHAAIDVVQVKIGTALLPALTGIMNNVAPLIANFADWADKNHIVDKAIAGVTTTINILKTVFTDVGNVINTTIAIVQSISSWFTEHERVIMSVVTALTVFFLPALIKIGVQSAISGAQLLAGFVADVVTTGVKAVVSAAQATGSFIAMLVTTGSEAWINGGKVVGSFVASMVTTGAQAVATAAQATGSFIVMIVTTGAKAVATAAQVAGPFVASMITTGAQAVVAGAQVVGSFIASMVTTGVQALIAGAQVTASFIASMVQAGASAVVQAAQVAGSFVVSLISAGTEAVTSAGKITGSFIVSMVQAGAAAIKQAAVIVAQFVACLVTAGAKAVWSALQITGSFIVAMVQAGVQAAITAGTFLATLIPAVISFAAEALIAAATAIPAILAGFGAWVVGAAAVAIANIAAFWPIYLAIAVIIGIIALVVLAVKNWGAIAAWFQGIWGAISGFFVKLFNDVIGFFKKFGLDIIEIMLGPIGLVIHFWQPIVGFFQGIGSDIGKAFSGLGTLVSGVWNGIANGVRNAINDIIRGINSFINAIDGIQIHIPSVSVGPVSTPGFDWNGVGIPRIPMLANGGQGLDAGYKIVGERGPELLYSGQGSSVFSNGQTNNMLNGGGGDHYTIVELDGNVLTTAVSKRQARMTRVRMARRAA